jgi:hypothetical protein
MSRYETLRKFRTRQLTVTAEWTYDDDVDTSFDETGETLRKLQSGDWVAMLVRVRVVHDVLGELAANYLGSCIYERPEKFMDHKECGAQNRRERDKARATGTKPAMCGSYFADMISEACSEARNRVRTMRDVTSKLRVREVQS